MTYRVKTPKKLIEVALPLDAINTEAARRKRKAPAGYPTTLHKWWAQRPVAAARAVLFSQLVNDPSWKWEMENPGETPPSHLKASWAAGRKRLFAMIEELVKWENTNNEQVIEKARMEIKKSWRETCELNQEHPRAAELFNPEILPAMHDPFAGAASIPMEAQRLGLEAFASDLNPVAVLINKAMIEIPPRFAGRPPVNPDWQGTSEAEKTLRHWHGAQGLAEDVLYYGQWMRDEAEKCLAHLYPTIEVTAEMAKTRPDLKQLVGQKLPVIAWLWSRTVKSPNPAYRHVDVPLASTFILSSKDGKEAYVQPVVEGDCYHFTVKIGTPPSEAKGGTTAGKRAAFRCLISNVPIDYEYIRAEGKGGRLGQKLMSTVVDGRNGRVFLPPTHEMESAGINAISQWKPTTLLHGKCRVNVALYGPDTFGDLFTSRQVAALTTFADLVGEVRKKVREDALAQGMADGEQGLEAGGVEAKAYAEAVSLYLAFAVDRMADYGSTIATWRTKDNAMRSTLASQSIPMTWDYAEGSPLAASSSGFSESVTVVARALEFLVTDTPGHALQYAAQTQELSSGRVVSTDPPYYNNIGYADLSDFFYVWLRRSLREVFPELLATMAVPKEEELVL